MVFSGIEGGHHTNRTTNLPMTLTMTEWSWPWRYLACSEIYTAAIFP